MDKSKVRIMDDSKRRMSLQVTSTSRGGSVEPKFNSAPPTNNRRLTLPDSFSNKKVIDQVGNRKLSIVSNASSDGRRKSGSKYLSLYGASMWSHIICHLPPSCSSISIVQDLKTGH